MLSRLLIFVFLIAPQLVQAGAPPSHAIWDGLLKKHVDGRGMVDYRGLKRDDATLQTYLDLLSRTPPAPGWSVNERMAYWINAYNAFTVRLILNHYPLESIKDIGFAIQVPFVNTPWAEKFFTIGGKKMSLDNIEHGTLRKQFTDPRIHFALVCAARSCPRLRNEAYLPGRLARQLDEQGIDFLNDPTKNAVTTARASLSKLFDWYEGDFETNRRSVVYWVNRYSHTKISDDTPISYLDYDWQLNEQ